MIEVEFSRDTSIRPERLFSVVGPHIVVPEGTKIVITNKGMAKSLLCASNINKAGDELFRCTVIEED